MITPRRIAAAALTAALSLGALGAVATPAEAKSDSDTSMRAPDTTWPG
jgi:hypothetical protein